MLTVHAVLKCQRFGKIVRLRGELQCLYQTWHDVTAYWQPVAVYRLCSAAVVSESRGIVQFATVHRQCAALGYNIWGSWTFRTQPIFHWKESPPVKVTDYTAPFYLKTSSPWDYLQTLFSEIWCAVITLWVSCWNKAQLQHRKAALLKYW